MIQKTPLYDLHCQANAKFTDFSGFLMPLHYGSQLMEHQRVRQDAGIFDVSHMGILDIKGTDATALLRLALANDIQKLTIDGKALYSCLLNHQGGIIDDLITYRLHAQHYRTILNASCRHQDVAWLKTLAADFDVELELREDLALLAIQGPKAIEKFCSLLTDNVSKLVKQLEPFTSLCWESMQIARTGYTGEDGLEIILPAMQSRLWWKRLLIAGVTPCGLGARDTLRLEAGLNLYGVDMNETTTPLESNLEWTVVYQDPKRNFIGREALIQQKKAGLPRQLVGLIMQSPGVLRNHQKIILQNNREGEITSGSFSPTLNHAIALARLPVPFESEVFTQRRGEIMPLKVVKPPFIRFNQSVYQEYKK